MYMEIVYKNHGVEVGTVEVFVPRNDVFSGDETKHILLGRKGLFDKYKITFNESEQTMNFMRVHEHEARLEM